jgi:hypothetical protein
MDYYELFKEIKEQGFDEKTALLTVIADALHISTVVEDDDFVIQNNFFKRVTKKIKDTLWEYPDDLEKILKLESLLHDYEIGKDLDGLGGCQGKTLKELYDEKKEEENL